MPSSVEALTRRAILVAFVLAPATSGDARNTRDRGRANCPARHPGARHGRRGQWATTFDVDKSVKLNGHPVPAQILCVDGVREKGDWTFVLDPQAHRYHMEPPDSSGAQIRFPVQVTAVPFTEVLTWSMPELRINGGTLVLEWERTRVAVDVEVEPSLVMTLPAAEAADYIGEFAFTEMDSTGKPGKVGTFTISHENETLKGRWTPEDPYFKKCALIRIGPDWFVPGLYDKNGQIYEVLKPTSCWSSPARTVASSAS